MKLKPLAITAWLVVLIGLSSGQLLNGTCARNHCGSNGDCIDHNWVRHKFFCRCDQGIGGAFCEMPCNLTCGWGQKCVIDDMQTPICVLEDHAYDTFNLLATVCDPGFGGYNCSVPIKSAKANPCLWNPCINGICLPGDGNFTCNCDDGFTGELCDEGTSCQDHECQGGGKCISKDDGYYCNCPLNRSGEFCENVSCVGLPDICNHGECVDDSNSTGKHFKCVCDHGFEGEFCNQDVNECKDKEACFNNSTCVNLHGSYRCDCLPGYSGTQCGEPVDLCQFTKCHNNGSCYHTGDQKPVCICQFGFTGANCEKPCIDGFGGINCDLPEDTVVCHKFGPKCANNGRCINKRCHCPPSFIGDHCEYTREEFAAHDKTCAMDPCENNGTCYDVQGRLGYYCQCEPGFAGDRCEIPINMCTKKPCLNGGNCTFRNALVSCFCLPGFEGERCEQKASCPHNQCANGGLCEVGLAGKTFSCKCPLGFSGKQCNETTTDANSLLLESICELRNCSALAGNNVCNKECNLKQCNFDDGDCSGGQVPFGKCPFDCADVFADGVCNPECDREECLYDGFDCDPDILRCPIRIRKHCAARFADGICDKECDSEGCGFDGGDCDVKTFDITIWSNIRIVVQLNPKEFQLIVGQALMELSSDINTTIRVQYDEIGPMVFKWNGHQELGRVPMYQKNITLFKTPVKKRTSTLMVVAYLEAVEICEDSCKFSSSQSIVDLIGASLAKTNGKEAFGLPITEAVVVSRMSLTPEEYHFYAMFVIISIFAILVIIYFAIVFVDRTRKQIESDAARWHPPFYTSFNATLSMESLKTDTNQKLVDYYNMHTGPGQTPLLQIAIDEEPSGPTMGEIPLHVEAAGPDEITSELTFETVNQVDSKYRRNVLHWLADNVTGKKEISIRMNALECIEAGADVNAKDIDNDTPLLRAAYARRTELVKLLMQNGADPSIFNNSHRNALHVAAANADQLLIDLLLQDPRIVGDIDEIDQHFMTPLMILACRSGDGQTGLAMLLIRRGANVNEDGSTQSKDSHFFKGRTALHYAALNGNVEMVRYLLFCGAEIDKHDTYGDTALMLAAREGHQEVVKVLVQRFASIFRANYFNKTAVQQARENHHRDVSDYLMVQEMNWHSNNTQRHGMVLNNPPPLPRQTRKVYGNARLTPPRSDISFSLASSPSPRTLTGSASQSQNSLPSISWMPQYHDRYIFSTDDYHEDTYF